MAFSQLFVCDTCEQDVVLVHADEWTPGKQKGEMLPYAGYGLVGGLLNRLWCPKCQAVKPFAFVTLSPPAAHAVVAYAEAQRLKCDGSETGPCPDCETVLTWEVDGQPCPMCKNGVFRFTGEWEDAV